MSDITTIRKAANEANYLIRIREHYNGLGRTYTVQVANRNKRLLDGGSYKTVWEGADICKAADVMEWWVSGCIA